MEKFFKLKQNKTSVKTEVVAGLTTFFTMAYIIFVNPEILSAANMDAGAVMIATCIAAAVGTILIGLLSNYPFAQAPGMGLNAFFAYTLCGAMGYSWRAALAAVFCSGIIFIIFTLTGLRSMIVTAIPTSLKRAISAGIGLFIAMIGLESAGIIATPAGGTPIMGFGDLGSPPVLLAVFCLVLAVALMCLKVNGSLFIAIAVTSVAGAVLQFGLGVELGMSAPQFGTSLSESFHAFGALVGQCFSGFGELFDTGAGAGVMLASVASLLIAITITDMFDTIGALVATGEKAGLLDKNGNLPKADKALLADAIATAAGAVLGTSTVTTYIESAAGVSVGGRTGLSSMVTGVMFIAAIGLSPLFGLIPGAATAPILVIVGILMVECLKDIKWGDITEAIPCFMSIVMMPFAYSIADGIGLGFIFYTVVRLFTRRIKEVHPVLIVFSLVFVLRYALMAMGKI